MQYSFNAHAFSVLLNIVVKHFVIVVVVGAQVYCLSLLFCSTNNKTQILYLP